MFFVSAAASKRLLLQSPDFTPSVSVPKYTPPVSKPSSSMPEPTSPVPGLSHLELNNKEDICLRDLPERGNCHTEMEQIYEEINNLRSERDQLKKENEALKVCHLLDYDTLASKIMKMTVRY